MSGSSYSIEEATGLPQNPTPFCKLDFAFLQRLVTLVEGRYAVFKALATVGQFVNLGSRRCGCYVVELIDGPHWDAGFVHLRTEVP